MKTFFHVTTIMLLGVLLGLAVRSMRQRGERPVVHSNDQPPLDASSVETQPIRLPLGQRVEFALTERSGEEFGSQQLQGYPYVVCFFFTTCPASCIQQTQKFKQLQQEFAGTAVRFVSISVDPSTDTPETLREYAARFGADPDQWLFMTGDMSEIRKVGVESFWLPVEEKFHTDRFVLIDAAGEIVGVYDWPQPRQLQRLKDDIRQLLEAV